jgi:type I restriction enzyme S subunit
MQQLLTGKKRLAGFSGEWEVKRFKDIFDRGNSKIHQIKTSDYQDSGDFPIIDQGKDLIVGYSDKKEKSYKCSKDGVIVFGDHTCIIKFINFDFVVGADGTQILTIKKWALYSFSCFST